jgi:hypothetical protein
VHEDQSTQTPPSYVVDTEVRDSAAPYALVSTPKRHLTPPSMRKAGVHFSKLNRRQQDVLLRIREAVQSDASLTTGAIVSMAFVQLWEDCTPEVRSFLQNFVDSEENARVLYHEAVLSSLMEQMICPMIPDKELVFPETITHVLRSVAERQLRIVNDTHSMATVRAAVIGPRRSGKTTLIYMFVKLLLRHLLSNGQWKRVFMFSVNWSHLLAQNTSLEQFYYRFTELLVNHLCKQRVSLSPYRGGLLLFFRKAISQRGPVHLPQELVRKHPQPCSFLRNIAARLQNLYHVQQDLPQFLNHVCSLPRSVAEAFSFHDVFYVFDHVDATHMYLQSSNGSTISERLSRYVLTNCAAGMVLFGCIDADAFMHCFTDSPYTECMLDALDAIETVNLVDDESVFSLYPDIPRDADLSALQGCPAFLAKLVAASRLGSGVHVSISQ